MSVATRKTEKSSKMDAVISAIMASAACTVLELDGMVYHVDYCQYASGTNVVVWELRKGVEDDVDSPNYHERKGEYGTVEEALKKFTIAGKPLGSYKLNVVKDPLIHIADDLPSVLERAKDYGIV